jgi:hypothetical protein
MTAITLNLPEDIYQYLVNRPDRDALAAAALHDVMAKDAKTEPAGAFYEVEGAIPEEHIEGIIRGLASIKNEEEGMELEEYMALRRAEKVRLRRDK